MNILALVEVHPLDGSDRFISARISSPIGPFDLPLSPEQADLIIAHLHPQQQEEEVEEEAVDPEAMQQTFIEDDDEEEPPLTLAAFPNFTSVASLPEYDDEL